MAHLHSKHTLSINLSNHVPGQDVAIFTRQAIQGNTTVTFLLSDIAVEAPGVQGLYIDFNQSTRKFYPASFNDRLTLNLPFTSIEHTYFQTTSTPDTLSAVFSVLYQPINGGKPLSATHIITFFVSAENVLDKNIELINTQIFTIAGNSSLFFNFENDENIIYPMALFKPLDFIPILPPGVYLNTDPETDPETTSFDLLSTVNRIKTEGDQKITII